MTKKQPKTRTLDEVRAVFRPQPKPEPTILPPPVQLTTTATMPSVSKDALKHPFPWRGHPGVVIDEARDFRLRVEDLLEQTYPVRLRCNHCHHISLSMVKPGESQGAAIGQVCDCVCEKCGVPRRHSVIPHESAFRTVTGDKTAWTFDRHDMNKLMQLVTLRHDVDEHRFGKVDIELSQYLEDILSELQLDLFKDMCQGLFKAYFSHEEVSVVLRSFKSKLAQALAVLGHWGW